MNRQEGRIHPGLAIVLAIFALSFILLTSRGCWVSPGLYLGDRNWFNVSWHFFTFSGLLQLILAVWVGVDAQKRGSNGYLWGLLVFFTSIIGLLVYLLSITDTIERISDRVNQAQAAPAAAEPAAPPPGPVVDAVVASCPACGGEIEEGFKACPSCGASLRCPGCDKTIRKGWKVCPWCTMQIDSGTT